jgi:sec-independent protein translocase protein TatC
MFLLGIGLTFETPILILLLTRLGIVSTATLLKKYKWAVLLAFIISAVITPSGDPVTQTIVAVPIIVLYGIGILISWFFRKRPEPSGTD